MPMRPSPPPRWISACCAALAFLLSPSPSAAPPDAAAKGADTVGLRLSLVCEQSHLTPGRTVNLGLKIEHEPGFHTYWKQPGIVGVPTTLRWELPPGFVAGELLYPAPEMTRMFNIAAQGYERTVLLQTRLQVPADLAEGTEVTLTAHAAWMCCAKTCHPGTTRLKLTLPVSTARPSPSAEASRFIAERASFPQPSPHWQARAQFDGKVVTLILRPLDEMARPLTRQELGSLRFFTEDGWINTDEPQQPQFQDNGELIMTLLPSPVFLGGERPSHLRGVLGRAAGWHSRGSLRSLLIAPTLEVKSPKSRG